ncbi:hypothetical protein ACQPX6_10780 [Actinomycetospora sp. CA-101289]|uniref:hypothetical protein n=1 Tax=Actinomycetospora sp. CA-101289 TaxID=3239893 RepID=UPI003D983B65
MDLTPYVSALRDDLAAAAAVGDEATSRAGTSLAAALEPAVRLAMMNALSDLAGEVTEALGDRSVSLRLSGREVKVVVDREPTSDDGGFFAGPASSPFAGAPAGGAGGPHRSTPPPPPGPGFPGGGEGPWGAFGGGQGFGGRGGPDVGDISRMTLRLVDQIKGQAERAAAAQGMSLNSWIGQAVQGALRQHGGRGGWGGWASGGDAGPDTGDTGGTGGSWDSGWDAGRAARDGGSSTGPTTPTDSTPGTDKPGTDETGTAKPGDDGPDGGGVDGWVRG